MRLNQRVSRWVQFRRTLGPERLLVLSFAGLLALGTIGFQVLPGLYTGDRLSWLDALFTTTSAVCVTGLIVVDTATYFTPFGQAYIALLIQVGGLGIITFTTLLMLALGRRLSMHHEAVSAGGAEVAPDVDFRELVRNVVRFTLALEAVGALILFVAWLPSLGMGAAWHAVFHAVSAFCNAGFSTFSDSLVGFQTAPVTLATIMGLIVAGGLGFLVMEEIHLVWKRRGQKGGRIRLSLHSQLVLWTTGIVLLTGWIACAALEWENTLAGLGLWDRLTNSLFLSVTPRTAGYNSVDYAATTDGTNFVTILLMSIGGSPGSTAGGLKTTTVAAIAFLALARLRGGERAHALSRTIPDDTIQRAVGLFAVTFGIVTLGILLLAVTQEAGAGPGAPGFLHYMFEAVSAFNTVGLSMGTTDDLDSAGKWIIILLMYVGRVGPLALAAAISLSRSSSDRDFRYAYEDVLIG